MGFAAKGAAEKGKLDITTYGYAWTATRAREMIWLGKGASAAGRHWPEAARTQWHGLMGRFRKPSKLLQPIMAEDGTFRECINFFGKPDVCFEVDAMEACPEWLEREVEERRRTRMEEIRKAWRASIEEK